MAKKHKPKSVWKKIFKEVKAKKILGKKNKGKKRRKNKKRQGR